MQSAFSGIELGKRSLFAHSRALQTVGHNLSNAGAEGYSRQRVELNATDPIYRPQLNRAETPGQIGQGVDIARVERVRDMLLERRIVTTTGDEAYWGTRDRYALMLEQIYNEPTENSVRTLMDRFWDGWQELSLYPEHGAARQAVLQRGRAVVDGVRLRYNSLDQIRNMLEDEIGAAVTQANTLIRDISDLNREITNVKAVGDNPNDLLDRRDLLTGRLAEIIEIRIDDRDPDEFSIYSGGYHIVQGRIGRTFSIESDRQNEGFSRVTWSHSGETLEFTGSKLGALLEMRDLDLRTEIRELDTMTINVVDLVNEIHRDGYGINGKSGNNFFVEYPAILNAQGNYDRDLDGTFDASYIFRITGEHELSLQAQIGLAGTMRLSADQTIHPEGILEVSYRPTDTVADVIARINQSGADVLARLNRRGQLEIKATATTGGDPDFVLRHVEDDGQFLTGYAGLLAAAGSEGAFDWAAPDAFTALRGETATTRGAEYSVAPLLHPSGWMEVNPAIVREPASIAASFATAGRPGEVGDGRAALAIAGIRNRTVGIGRSEMLDDYFADSVARAGLRGQEAETTLNTYERILKDLGDMRESISGVSIDEELAQMLKFQHGYQAAARFVANVDEMLDTIINRMAV